MPRVSNSSPMMFYKMERSQSSFAVETFIQEFSWAVHTIKAKVHQIKDKHENHSFQENAVKINPPKYQLALVITTFHHLFCLQRI